METENVSDDPKKPVYRLKDRFQKFFVQTIEYDNKGNISALVIVDNHGTFVFTWKAKKWEWIT